MALRRFICRQLVHRLTGVHPTGTPLDLDDVKDAAEITSLKAQGAIAPDIPRVAVSDEPPATSDVAGDGLAGSVPDTDDAGDGLAGSVPDTDDAGDSLAGSVPDTDDAKPAGRKGNGKK